MITSNFKIKQKPYRDAKGKFAKRPRQNIPCGEIPLGKPMPCCLLGAFETDKPKYSLPPDSVFEKDVEKFMEEHHNGDPQYIHLRFDEECRLNIVGDILQFKQSYPKFEKNGKLHKKFMVNVIDLDDNKMKILVCGNQLMRNLYRDMQSAMEMQKEFDNRPPLTFFERLIVLFNKTILGKEVEPEVEPKDKPFDVTITKVKRDRVGRMVDYRIKRIEDGE